MPEQRFPVGTNVTTENFPHLRMEVIRYDAATDRYFCSWAVSGGHIVTDWVAAAALQPMSDRDAYPHRYK